MNLFRVMIKDFLFKLQFVLILVLFLFHLPLAMGLDPSSDPNMRLSSDSSQTEGKQKVYGCTRCENDRATLHLSPQMVEMQTSWILGDSEEESKTGSSAGTAN